MTLCRFATADQPRMVCHSHHDRGATCDECTPCPAAHCRICGVAHVEGVGTCPGCLAETRETLADIGRMCGDLPAEAEVRGVEGEAFVLLGPAADPEARGHFEASVLAGRVARDELEDEPHKKGCDDQRCTGCAGEFHPLFVAGSWAMLYRAEFEHDEPIGAVDLTAELGYIERNLTYMASWPHVPFEDLARDLRKCRAHLAEVLADAERGVRANVSCFDCGGDLQRTLKEPRPCRHTTPARVWWATLGTYPEIPRSGVERLEASAPCDSCIDQGGFDDRYACRRCRRVYTIAEYNFALRAALETPQMEESA